MIQAYERRTLTYVPTNQPGFQVEMGNIGQHYFDWRYRNLGYCVGQPVVAPRHLPRLLSEPPALPEHPPATGTAVGTGTPAATGTAVGTGTATGHRHSPWAPAPRLRDQHAARRHRHAWARDVTPTTTP